MFEGEGTAAAADELAARLVALRQAIDLLELEFSTTAAAFAATDAYDRAGSVSAFDWIRHNCKVSGHVTYDRLRVGEQMEKLPTAYLALAEGSIGFAHVSLIAGVAKAVQESPTAKHFDEGRLLARAAEESVSRFRYTCERARHADDPEGLAFEQFKGVEARRLELLPCEDGLFSLRGVLDPVGAGVLRTALEPLAKRNGRSDARHRERRLADALIELAQHGRKASLMVTTSLETLRRAPPQPRSSSRLPSRPGPSSVSPATARSPACCSRPSRRSSTWAAAGGWSHPPSGGRFSSAMAAAAGRAATARPPGPTLTT